MRRVSLKDFLENYNNSIISHYESVISKNNLEKKKKGRDIFEELINIRTN